MEIIINDEGFFYEAQQVLMLFFPLESDAKLICNLKIEGDKCICRAEVTYEKTGRSEQSGSASVRRDIADTVKRAVYFASKEISDRRLPWGILTGIRPAKPIRQMIESGASKEETAAFFKNNYYAEEKKINLALSIAESEMRHIKDDPKSVSVYIGIPFCPTRCSYCSFISHDASKMLKLSNEYVKKLIEEMDLTAEIMKRNNLYARCVYFGGGTPTALDVTELEAVLMKAKECFVTDETEEFTVEAGRPDTITREKLQVIKKTGADRISINPQTVHDKTLERIGRKHSFKEFEDSFSLAREEGFDNINCDVIAGLPGESVEDFRETIDKMLIYNPENLTVHTLYLKRASELKRLNSENTGDEEIEKMVFYAQEKLVSEGFKPYYLYKQKATLGNLENVGFSRDGFECIYNIDTMSDEVTVFALGAGGVTKIVMGDRIERIFNFKNADEYIKRFDEIKERKESINNFYGE